MSEQGGPAVFSMLGPIWACLVGLTSAGILAMWSAGSIDPQWTTLVIAVAVAGLSPISFSLYGWDKLRAKWSARRVPERLLLLLDLCGGWPGGLLARRLFRHKTIKSSYRIKFTMVVLLHSAVMAALVLLFQRASDATP